MNLMNLSEAAENRTSGTDEGSSITRNGKYVSKEITAEFESRKETIKEYQELVKTLEQLTEVQEKLNKAREEGNEADIKSLEKQLKATQELHGASLKAYEDRKAAATEAAQTFKYSNLSTKEKEREKRQEAQAFRDKSESLTNEKSVLQGLKLEASKSGDKETAEKLEAQIKEITEQIRESDKAARDSDKQANKIQKESLNKANLHLAAAIKSGDEQAIMEAQNEVEAKRREAEDRKAEERHKAAQALREKTRQAIAAGFKKSEEVMREIVENDTKYASRLQGYTKSYTEIVDKISSTLGLNPFITQRNTVQNLNSLVERGIAYNIEQRAFLNTVADKVAATFDKQNETLERLIRIQQADSTAARLGLEAELTKFFNATFEDTSYLASNLFDQVTNALLEAESQMTRDQAVEFEYVIQRWLGSLSSLGLSSSAVTSIATGLGYLGSGNIKALSGTPLETVFALSAAKSGLSYSDMLINSIDGSSVNLLLKSMVSYLKEIAEGQNQVVKSAYGNIFNLTQSDFRAIQNITEADIANIVAKTSTYVSAYNEAQNQISYSNLKSRTSIGAMIGNVMDNFIYSWGSQSATNPVTYALTTLNNIINEATGGVGITLPVISIHGYSFDLKNSINNIATFISQAYDLLGSVGKIAGAIGKGNGLDLSAWKAEEYTSRGKGFAGISEGLRTGTSMSEYVATGSSSDIEESTVGEQSEKAKKTSSQMGFDEKAEKDFNKSKHQFDEMYDAVYAKDKSVYAMLVKIEDNTKRLSALTLSDDTLSKLSSSIGESVIRAEIDKESPESISLADLLPALYETISGGKIKTMLSEVDRTVPGFNTSMREGIKVKEVM